MPTTLTISARKQARAEIKLYAKNIEMDGTFRNTEEGDIHWTSDYVKNKPRLHIRVSYFRGVKWYAGFELPGFEDSLYFSQTPAEGCETLEEAVLTVRNKMRKVAKKLSVYSRWF